MKTVEEKAKDYAHKLRREIGDIGGSIATIAYKTYVDATNEANKWISVEEELPPCSYEDILVKGYDIDGNVIYGIAYMHDTSTGIPDKNNFIVSEYINKITHWKPIN